MPLRSLINLFGALLEKLSSNSSCNVNDLASNLSAGIYSWWLYCTCRTDPIIGITIPVLATSVNFCSFGRTLGRLNWHVARGATYWANTHGVLPLNLHT